MITGTLDIDRDQIKSGEGATDFLEQVIADRV
jgi:hypothetical protein